MIRLIGTAILGGVAGAAFTAIVAHALGVPVAIAASVGGLLMAVFVALIIAREHRRAA